MSDSELEQLGINVIRGLAMDAPQKANSGHPGTAMALAPLAHVLFHRIMKHDPEDPTWADRDRFILSCGHASILLYSMLYLHGYGLSIEDLKQFRQWGSLTPGHPEVHHTSGVEVTTGPLGQGIANSVGTALAERWLRSKYGPDLVDHHTFVVCSDGDLMEGISHEAGSLAGHLGLGRLIAVYDDNHITIDGNTELAYTDDVPGRFRSYGWHVEDLGEMANDIDGLEAAVRTAMADEQHPSLLVLRSHIGWPSPNKTDSASAHGTPLGDDEIARTKEILGLPADESFWVPQEVLAMYRGSTARSKAAREDWEKRYKSRPEIHRDWEAGLGGHGTAGWHRDLPVFAEGTSTATRRAIKQCIDSSASHVPGLLPGSADLTENTGVELAGAIAQTAATPGGAQIHYGIREHAMGAVMNGAALHGGVLPVGGTFFIFSDYMRPAVRLASLSKAHVVYFWTHDSVGLGEDGPTHQPIEQLASLRAMPGLRIIRPADANETSHAWRIAVDHPGPTALILSRQNLPVLAGTAESFNGVSHGGYVIDAESGGEPDVVLIGTGSEVHICVKAAQMLRSGIAGSANSSAVEIGSGVAVNARVVSLPSWDLFEAQDVTYQQSVIPPGVPALAVEAGASFGWSRWAQDSVSIDHFGASAPGPEVLSHFGFDPTNVADRARRLLT